jgi:hypothetical protein
VAKKKHGRGQAQRRRPTPRPTRPSHQGSAQDHKLLQSLRQALRSDGPLDLLALVSGLVAVTDPRGRDPFTRDEQRASLGDLVESFLGTPYAETTSALTAIRALVPDELMRARIGHGLAERRHPMPDWLRGLDQARVEPDVWFLTHVLGDGDDYLLGVTLPSGHSLSALVYVDHNLGTVVKDAFVVPEPLEDLAIKVGSVMDDPDQSLTRTDPATARAAIEAAIASGVGLYPPIQTDSWPMCRPVVEWMLRMLPSGAGSPEPKEWSEEETAAIATDFLASSFGAPFDGADERSLLESLLWFATSYATGDPWRWSPVTVEMLLVDWFPRKVVAEPSYLAKLPNLVRAYIGYCHDRNGIRADLTSETLAAVDHHEPEYLRLIDSDPQEAMAGLASALWESERLEGLSDEEIRLEYMADEVGGLDALMRLDTEPLPDEEFDWAGIPGEIQPTVRAILDECDACADALLDPEHRTAMRRFLARAATNEPTLFRRKASPARGAAAVAWVVCTANRIIGSYRSPMTGKDLLAHFGITGSVSDRAQSLVRAADIDLRMTYGSMRVGDPGLLVSRRRSELVDDRDRTLTKE